MEQVLPSTPFYPAQLTQLKRGIKTLAASQAETMQVFTVLHRAAHGQAPSMRKRRNSLRSLLGWRRAAMGV